MPWWALEGKNVNFSVQPSKQSEKISGTTMMVPGHILVSMKIMVVVNKEKRNFYFLQD